MFCSYRYSIRCFLPLLFLFTLPPVKSLANGWEHTAIPFSALVAALASENAQIRLQAAKSMGFRNQPGMEKVLIRHLEQGENNSRVRQEIYHALGKTGAISALPAIKHCLKNELKSRVKAECAETLGIFQTSDAEELAIALLYDDEISIRIAAAKSLGSYNTPETLRALTGLLNDEDSSVVARAIESIGQTGASGSGAVLVKRLEATEDKQARINILKALALLGDLETMAPVRKIFEDSMDPDIRRFALIAMASMNTSESEPYFLASLRDQDPTTRILALHVIRESQNPQLVFEVISAAIQESASILNATEQALLEHPNDAILRLSLLIEYLKTVIALDAEKGIELFRKTAEPFEMSRRSPTQLKIAEGFYQARWQALYGLGYTQSQQAESILAAALLEPDARIRAVAVRSLGVLRTKTYLANVAEKLNDPSAEVRWTAARVLGRSAETGFEQALINSLQDKSALVRRESALSLGYLKAEKALVLLVELSANDPDNRVREAAAYATSLINNPVSG